MLPRFHLPPIVERELRLSSRQWSTYWTRVGAGAVGIVFACWVLGLSPRMGQAGRSSFQLLAIAATIAVMVKGVQLASEAFAREKREETLGIILLTPLRSLEIVLGKLLSSLLPAFYQFVAIVPVLALPILAGGVSAGQFILLVVGLANLAFLTVSVGLYYSTEHWHERQAAVITYVVLGLGCFLLPPIVGGAIGALSIALLEESIGLFTFSPLFPIGMAAFHGAPSLLELGASLLGVQALSWIFIRMTCRSLRTCCDKKPDVTVESLPAGAQWLETVPQLPGEQKQPEQADPVWVVNDGGGVRRQFSDKERARLLDHNPLLWLAMRWRPSAVLAFLVGGLGLFTAWMAFMSMQFVLFVTPWFAVLTCYFINAGFKFYVTVQASQALLPRNGEDPLQILLSTPIKPEELLNPHVTAIRGPLVSKVRFLLWAETAWILLCVPWQVQDDNWAGLVVAVAGLGMAAMLVPDLKAVGMHGLWQSVVNSNKRESKVNTLWILFIPCGCAFLLMIVGGAFMPPFGFFILPMIGWLISSYYVNRSFRQSAEQHLQNDLPAWALRRVTAEKKPKDFWERTGRGVLGLWKGSPQGSE